MIEPPANEPAPKAQERVSSGDLKTSGPLVNPSGPLEQPQAAVISSLPQSAAQQGNNSALPPGQQAEQYYQQGRARFDRKEYHAAVHLLREAVKLDSSRAPYHFHLGLALIRNPRTRREAIEHLTKAAELEPYNAQIRVKMGMLYKEAGLQKKAEAHFREALSLDPDNRIAKRELNSLPSKAESSSIWKSDFGSLAKRLFKK
jgi:tetratricopeptide (TPR) repeat protein